MPVPDLWSYDLAMLERLVRIHEFHDDLPAPDVSNLEVRDSLGRLAADGYIGGTATPELGIVAVAGVTAKALRATQAWPSATRVQDEVIAALDALMAEAKGEDKSRLKKVRDYVLTTGRDTLVKVATDIAVKQAGI